MLSGTLFFITTIKVVCWYICSHLTTYNSLSLGGKRKMEIKVSHQKEMFGFLQCIYHEIVTVGVFGDACAVFNA